MTEPPATSALLWEFGNQFEKFGLRSSPDGSGDRDTLGGLPDIPPVAVFVPGSETSVSWHFLIHRRNRGVVACRGRPGAEEPNHQHRPVRAPRAAMTPPCRREAR